MSDRTRTYAWHDPLVSAQAAPTMRGLDFLRAMSEGKLPIPPIMETLAIRGFAVEEGVAVFECEPAEFHYNPIGVAHGGLAATLLDSAMACAVQTMLPAGAGYTTVEMKINFVRPLTTASGMVRAEGKVIQVGQTIATAEGRITDARGKLCAFATETCLILRAKAEV